MANTVPLLLALETSCDDTGAAVLRGLTVLSNRVAGQLQHAEFGGVVPELASRAHQTSLWPVVQAALDEAGVRLQDLDAVVCTQGPGLLGSLLVGHSFAKSVALALSIPLYHAHHMRAHVLAHFLNPSNENSGPTFPFLCATVSGGHTQLLRVNSPLEMVVLGETLDDAVGEAYDKAAKMLGLGYPGGPEIDRLASQAGPERIAFGKPSVGDLNYSFSGLKTSFLNTLTKLFGAPLMVPNERLPEVCASMQDALLDHLLDKLVRAVEQTGLHSVAVAGGVSANSDLRRRLTELGTANGWSIFLPPLAFTTDNAAMVGADGYFQRMAGIKPALHVPAQARIPLQTEPTA